MQRKGIAGALLDEYEKAISELICTIDGISETELTIEIDHNTNDSNCRSFQSILTHVVSAGNNYAIGINNLKKEKLSYKEKVFRFSIKEYKHDLMDLLTFTEEILKDIEDVEFEQQDNSRKILTRWGQIYDVEQMMEHAIVHVLRHRRQIERLRGNFK